MATAADIFGGRLAVPSEKSAEAWGRVPVGVRERAFWSAKVTHAQHVADLKAACLDCLEGARVKVRDLHMHRWTDAELEEVGEDGVKRGDRTILMTREAVVGEMRKRALERGLTPTGPRAMEDIAHESRLRLIGEMAEETARERARFERGNDREVLFMWPAQELVRDEYREHPRDWGQRWQAAAESVGWEGVARNGEWIARKDSPIWIALSRFGQPFPPFDYNSGMGTRDVERDKAVELGLVEEGEEIANPGELFREQLGASVQGMGDTEREWLKRTIEEAQGGEVRFTPDGRVEWTPPAPEVPPPSPTEPPGPDAAAQVRLRQTRDNLVEQLRAKQAELEAEEREAEAAEREVQRREGEKRRVVEALKGEAERRRGEEARTAEEERRHRAEETQRQREEELARRGEERLWRQMESEGVAAGFQSRIHAAYTADVARRARPPEIHVDRRIPRSYLTEDGKKLFIGADAQRPEDLDGVLDDFGTKLEAGRRFDVERRLQWRRERMMIWARPIRGEHTWEEDARAVNPKYGTGNPGYRVNCQRTVAVYVARRRGMEVTAKPKLVKNDPYARPLHTSDFYENAPAWDFLSPATARRWIENKLLSCGDGACGVVRVAWKDKPGAHVFIAEQHGGETVFLDPQKGRLDCTDCFPRAKEVQFIRVDNLRFGVKLGAACEVPP